MVLGSAIFMTRKYQLTKEEKREFCKKLTEHLIDIRIRLGMTQEELGHVCGISRVTISQIESGHVKMNWLHFNAIMFVCIANKALKEYLYANGMLGDKLLCFYQNPEDGKAVINVNVDEDKIKLYKDLAALKS